MKSSKKIQSLRIMSTLVELFVLFRFFSGSVIVILVMSIVERRGGHSSAFEMSSVFPVLYRYGRITFSVWYSFDGQAPETSSTKSPRSR